MHLYPKIILNVEQQIQSYIDAGMGVSDIDEAKEALQTIGYYRLRGYCFHLYDNDAKKYRAETNFSDVLKLYKFDMELSHLLFEMASSIEVSLRSRLIDALLVHNDALILMDPAVFKDKSLYWRNMGAIASEISRSNDVFIKHNFINHDGEIPLWAAVEVMSFGTLSKVIKNLKTGEGSSYSKLAENYRYISMNGKKVKPSKDMLTSWIQAVSVLRNICAHNSRIYNRAISTAPEIVSYDRVNPQPRYNGLYQVVLAMKYLRPTDEIWCEFVQKLKCIFMKYIRAFEYGRMNFPEDWENHFEI